MELKMENEDNIERKERFNLRVAQQAYRMSMSTDAERYLFDIPKKQPKQEQTKAFKPKETRTYSFAELDEMEI